MLINVGLTASAQARPCVRDMQRIFTEQPGRRGELGRELGRWKAFRHEQKELSL